MAQRDPENVDTNSASRRGAGLKAVRAPRWGRIREVLAPLAASAFWLGAIGAAHAQDGGNEVCPANYAGANDVRERFDERGRLIHQLRLQDGQRVQEVSIDFASDRAVRRTELSPGQRRVSLSTWNGNQITLAECHVNGKLTARAEYRYDGPRVLFVTKTFYDPAPTGSGAAGRTPRIERIKFFYDLDGQQIGTEVRDQGGRILSSVRSERPPLDVPVQLKFTAGGSYQSNTQLYDVTAGIGIRRSPKAHRYGSDPLEVELDGIFRFHRASGITSTDQTTVRFSADYHEILPRITLFTFTSTDRNVPANLRLNLEQALLGAKLDIVRGPPFQFDVSFAPIWNFRSIVAPAQAGETAPAVNETTSKLRGSFRARAGWVQETWSLRNTLEFLPTFHGDDVAQEDGFWNRTVLRNTVVLDVHLTQHLTFREEFKYVRDPAMRAQASCPDSANPLCRGYTFASTTALVLSLDL